MILRIVALNKNLGLWETARLFALVNIAMADAYIAGWESKFYHNFWRPYSAIHNAFLDGNNQTEEDFQWEPALPTPPVQDYPPTVHWEMLRQKFWQAYWGKILHLQ